MMSNSKPDMIGPSVDVNAAYSVWESILESFGKSYFRKYNYFVCDCYGIIICYNLKINFIYRII